VRSSSGKVSPAPLADFVPSGFFVLRTPLLPFDEIETWSAGLPPSLVSDGAGVAPAPGPAPWAAADSGAQPSAVPDADRHLLRTRMRRLVERPEILEALFVASPSLVDALAAWREDAASRRGRRAERSLVRYLLRMAARPTPFGLLAGWSTGTFADSPAPSPESSEVRLTLAPRAGYRRHTRLDMEVLLGLAEQLQRDPVLRGELRFRPNSSLYRAAGRLRYAAAAGERAARSYSLVAVEPTAPIESTLERARGGALLADLVAALVRSEGEAAGGAAAGEALRQRACAFVDELVEAQLLVAELAPMLTGREALAVLIEELASLGAGEEPARRLAAVRDNLVKLDTGGLGAAPRLYRRLAAGVEALAAPVDVAHLFQVDLVKPLTQTQLGPAVLAEVARGVAILHQLAGGSRPESLETFRRAFARRYGELREVPLAEALDEEAGIGFAGAATGDGSPLLRGLDLSPPAGERLHPWGARQELLLVRLLAAQAAQAARIDLSAEDLRRMAPAGRPAPLPDAFEARVAIAAASPEAAARGEFQVLLLAVRGPSGAGTLGRFCHADPPLLRHVEAHLRAEETHRSAAVFAEIVHLPQGRAGNVLARPVVRAHEIPFLGRSGAAEERQIPVGDLVLSLHGERIVLRSRRLGCEVVPRLTSAHNFATASLSLYRFLCTLQLADANGHLAWSWGPLASAPFLPRLTHGRLVLCRAAWQLGAGEIRVLAAAAGAARREAAGDLRRRRRLPRFVTVEEGGAELLVDLDNPLAIDSLADLLRGEESARLQELFPGPEALVVRGPEGRYVHELVIPFHRRSATSGDGGEAAAGWPGGAGGSGGGEAEPW
jgi:hypothetical protein